MSPAALRFNIRGTLPFLFSLLLSSCATELPECDGPRLSVSELRSIKRTFLSSGPKAFLVLPNPIVATNIPTIQSTDPLLSRELDLLSLPGLVSPSRLENPFLKIRIKSMADDTSTLATPNASGAYQFALSDPHYGETMAYFSITAIQRYVESLGFSVVKSRPLYVMVRAEDEEQKNNPINAIYTHNYLNPSLPRMMRFYGGGNFAPSMDRNMFWHEFGHFFNESVSAETGIDFAGDSGAVFSEGGSLHEALADYIAESTADQGTIGEWIARNFPEVPAGAPLRSAIPKNDDFNDFKNVSLFDTSGKNLNRYRTAEWLTRVLWDIRSRFVTEDKDYGSIIADRMIFSAVSRLSRDSSIKEFANSLKETDQKLHCGLHSRSIKAAFESRGFSFEPPQVTVPLLLQASPVGNNGSPKAGEEVGFVLRVTNPNGETARNVRVILESGTAALTPTLYMQGFGDLPGGGTIVVGSGGLGLENSVYGTIDRAARTGSRLPYKLKIKTDNGPETSFQGEVGL